MKVKIILITNRSESFTLLGMITLLRKNHKKNASD